MPPRANSIRPYLRRLAGWTWNRQNDAKAHGLSLQEETLTEILLLQIANDWAGQGVRAKLFTRAQEAVNGADWEWFFQGRDCAIGYRVQAKRLYASGRYQGEYGGHDPAGSQSSKLIGQAASRGMYPIYIFYNHSSSSAFTQTHPGNFRKPSYWGCSFASAQSVKKANSRSPKVLIKHMRPWHELFDNCLMPSAATLPTGSQSSQKQPTTGSRLEGIGDGFQPQRPDWVEFLNGVSEGETDALEQLMDESDLGGIAFFDIADASLFLGDS